VPLVLTENIEPPLDVDEKIQYEFPLVEKIENVSRNIIPSSDSNLNFIQNQKLGKIIMKIDMKSP
jgi:hypothetical protein